MSLEVKNKKAYFDFFIEDEIEAGLELLGKEVKSIRAGKCNLKGSWCGIVNGEMFVNNIHISPYQESSQNSMLTRIDPYRVRKLLLHKREINKLNSRKQLEGVTFVPLKMYERNGRIKVLVGICKGKKKYDKRETIKEREIERNIRKITNW